MTDIHAESISIEPPIVTATPDTVNSSPSVSAPIDSANSPGVEIPAPEPQEPRYRTLADKIRRRTGHPLDASGHKQDVAENVGPASSFASHQMTDRTTGLPAMTPDRRNRIEGVSPPETKDFSKEVVDGLRAATESYVSKLVRMKETPITINGRQTTAYDEMKRHEGLTRINYSEDDEMIRAFTTLDPETNRVTLKTAAEINSIIANNPEIMSTVMEQAEKWAEDSLASMGIRAEMTEPGHRTLVEDLPNQIDLPVGQGPWNAKARRLVEWIREPLNRNSRGNQNPSFTRGQAIVATSAVGAYTGMNIGSIAGPAGATIGFVAGGILGPKLTERANDLIKNGVTVRFIRDANVLTQAQRGGEAMRADYLFNIDPKNPLNSPGLEDAFNQAMQIIYLRAEYMRGLGVSPDKLDAFSDQFLYRQGESVEQTNSVTKNEVRRAFERLGGWQGGRTPTERRDIYRRAQSEVAVNNYQKQINAVGGQTRGVDEGQRIADALAANQPGGETHQRTTRQAREEAQRLQTDRSALDQRTATLTAYNGRLETAAEARRKVTQALARITRGGLPIAGTSVDAIRELNRTIGEAGFNDVTMVPDENGILRPIPGLFERSAQLRGEVATAIAGISGRRPGESVESFNERRRFERADIDTAFQRRREENAAQRRIVDAAIQRLNTDPVAAIRAGEQAVNSDETRAASQTLREIDQAYQRLSADPALNASIIAGDYDGALLRINALNIWPQADNNLEENRLALHEAIIHARAYSQMHDPANIPNYAALELGFNAVTQNPNPALRITETQLRGLTIAELTDRANSIGAAAIVANLADAQQWANLQLEYTQRAVADEARNVQNAETAQTRNVARVDTAPRREQLEMAQEVYNRRDEIGGRATNTFIDPTARASLESSAIPTAGTDGYTASEVASGLPRNILELVNIITDYQNAPDRDAAFAQVYRNLGSNPTRLIGFINNSYGERLGTRTGNINTLSRRFGNALRTGGITLSYFDEKTRKGLANEFIRI